MLLCGDGQPGYASKHADTSGFAWGRPKGEGGIEDDGGSGSGGDSTEGDGVILTAAEALVPSTGCLLGVHESDRRRSYILDVARLSPSVAEAILAFDPQADPAAIVHDTPECRVILTRMHLRASGDPEAEMPDHLHGGSVLQMVIDRRAGLTWLLTLVRDRTLPPFSDKDIHLLSGFRPSLQALLRQDEETRRRLAMSDMVDGSLDSLAFGLLLVNAERRALWANAAAQAILASSEVLHIVGRRLKAREPRWDLRLREIVHELAESRPGASRALSVSCDRGPHLQLGFVRLSGELPDTSGVVIAVFISGSGVADLSASLMRELFDLTPVEAEIARLICQGFAPAEAAERLRLSVHTVRDYLKPIFQKMGVHRQADMVRVAAGFAGLLRLTPNGGPRSRAGLPPPRSYREN